MVVAIVFLAIGVFEYALFAMAEPGTTSWYTSFFWCMGALFFFNLPIVIKKRYARKQWLRRQRDSGQKVSH